MPSYEDDTRKVQTAVTGRPGSDQPVFLPFDHDDFDGFMRGRSRDDFYCGILLGGCGKKLTAKRYLHEKCHFAHRPPVHCRRTQTGEDSADHLYIGQALHRWLQQERHRDADLAYPDLGSGPGGAVEVRFGQGRRLIRVQLSRLTVPVWEAVHARLSDAHTHVQWAYGPHSGLRHGVRFTCRTEGGSRVVYVGTQTPDRTVEWTALDNCRLANEGIVTPHATGAAPAVAFPLAPGSIAFTVTTEATAPDGPTRLLYEADVQPTGFTSSTAHHFSNRPPNRPGSYGPRASPFFPHRRTSAGRTSAPFPHRPRPLNGKRRRKRSPSVLPKWAVNTGS